MKKVLFSCIAFSALLLTSCGGGTESEGGMRKGIGDVYYGGVFRMNEIEDFRDLNPLNITEVASQRITNQVYEGLVKLDQATLKVIPCLAEKVEKNEDASVWTFYLRKGVHFHDDSCFADGKGREMNAKDVKYCFDRLCASSPSNQQYYATFKDRVLGANEYFESTVKKSPLPDGVKGVKVLDDYTVQVTLNFPFAGFDNILAMPGCWVYPHEAAEKYGDEMRVRCVGTGPFRVNKIKEGDMVLLERNPNYWGTDSFGNKLPYLDGVKFTFIKEKKQEFLQFRKGELDMVYRLPTEMLDQILSEFHSAKEDNRAFVLQNEPAMSTYYYGMLNVGAPFNDIRVRQAFNYAIDREKLVKYTLKGDGIPGTYGLVPPVEAFKQKGFQFDKLKGYSLDVDKAKKLLAEAGYGPGKKPFPPITLQINSGGGDRNVLTAQVVQSMLKDNLGIEVNIDQMPFAQHLEKLETGKSLFYRSQWIADYPDPEAFLVLFYGKMVPEKLEDRSSYNTFRYKSAKFDSLFTMAMKETDEKKRFELYTLCDQVALDDAVMIPLFYDESYRLLQTNVRNFDCNAMEYRDFTKVYFVPEKKKDDKKK
ncbi:MAG TPA: ABC transporter substrate-binding protein [Bacteroidia bacterium]|jgi:peptide/nickel transport system substrate-binding protein